MVPAVSNRISRVPPYSGYHYLLSDYVYGPFTLFGQTFQTVPLLINSNIVVLQPQNCLNNSGLGSSHFDRHYSGNHYCFLFLRLMRCFSSPGLPPDFRRGTPITRGGLSHSETCGSIRICQSPQFIAAYHVLLRL